MNNVTSQNLTPYAKRFWMGKSDFAKYSIKLNINDPTIGTLLKVERTLKIPSVGSSVAGTIVNLLDDMMKELLKKEEQLGFKPWFIYKSDLTQQPIPSLLILQELTIETYRLIDSVAEKIVMYERIGSADLCYKLQK